MKTVRRNIQQFNNSLNRKLILFFVVLIFIALITVGITGYVITERSLDSKGEIILKNSVLLALEIIDTEHQRYVEGQITEAEAQENIKTFLLGPMNEDGTRALHGNIDLGEHGYFIIYDLDGNEVMHPTLEGKNVWDATSFDDDDLYVVQEQVEVGSTGGGFTYYSWLYPHSTDVGKKISYVDFDPNWQWVVAATAYTSDFNSEAKFILMVTVILMLILLIIATIVTFRYIRRTTKPILDVTKGMAGVSMGYTEEIPSVKTRDELELLVNGYNDMIKGLLQARKVVNERNERLSYLAFNDDLTGLANRHGFKEKVNEIIASDITEGSILQVDIRNIKAINSTFGLAAGDHLIHEIGKVFEKRASTGSVFARTAGNEFSIWCHASDKTMIESAIDDVRQSVNTPGVQGNISHAIDLHFSCAFYPDHGEDFDTLYRNVSVAMKHAKESGDIRVRYFDELMEKELQEEMAMRTHLERAIENHEITAWYQRKVDYTTGKTTGVEALARWQSEDLGFVSPGVFIPAVHKFHLDLAFGDYMIKHVFAAYDKIRDVHGDIKVAVNISPAYFDSDHILETTKWAIETYKVPADRIIYEVTEDIFIGDFEGFSLMATALKKLGISLSLDDFGTGYSSLNYLRNIDIDEIKVDKVFIDQIEEDPQAMKLLVTMCNMAEQLGYDMVAEGVETEAQLTLISQTSLKTIQGYLFSKPEPLA